MAIDAMNSLPIKYSQFEREKSSISSSKLYKYIKTAQTEAVSACFPCFDHSHNNLPILGLNRVKDSLDGLIWIQIPAREWHLVGAFSPVSIFANENI